MRGQRAQATQFDIELQLRYAADMIEVLMGYQHPRDVLCACAHQLGAQVRRGVDKGILSAGDERAGASSRCQRVGQRFYTGVATAIVAGNATGSPCSKEGEGV